MSRLPADLEVELEDEYEYEDEHETEWEDEGEEFLGALGGIARTVGSLLGGDGEGESEWESEWESEDELEGEDEDEGEEFLGALGGIARSVGSLLGEGEDEWESEGEAEGELEGEAEAESEAFFKALKKGFRVAAPFLRTLAKTAGPLVATAVGGPAAGMLARAVTSQLEGEAELEGELEAELEEMATAPVAGSQLMAEMFAHHAASAQTESEAEAFAGVAAYAALSPRDRRDLARMLPALLRGSAVITRLLHGQRQTRPAVRLVPGIVDAAGRTLARRVAAGEPVGPADVGSVLGAATRTVLSGGPARDAVIRRHARGLAYGRRRHGYGGRSGQRRPHHHGGHPRGQRRYGTSTIHRRPTRSVVTNAGRVSRPRTGFVRVVTPVRVPARGGQPARTVRVVSDVRVPRGATTAGRPVSVPARSGRR